MTEAIRLLESKLKLYQHEYKSAGEDYALAIERAELLFTKRNQALASIVDIQNALDKLNQEGR